MIFNRVVLLVFFLASMFTFSQNEFKKGYFVNNSNEKIECLINNLDWKNNPTEFSYKLVDGEESKKMTLMEAKEFGIENEFKFERVNVKIERSTVNLNQINNSSKLNFKEETLYLKIVCEGNATLYSYQESNLIKFFYKIGDKEIKL